MPGQPPSRAETAAWWGRLSVRHLFLLVPWVGVVIAATRPIRDNSFLWHVRAGELQLQGGEVLRTDPFSFTFGGQPWRTQSWLADLLYGWLERVTGGLNWVPWLLIVCGGATMLLVGVVIYRRVRQPLSVGLALVILLWLGLTNLVPRPVLFSFVLLALLVLAMDGGSEWAAPFILWVWAGLHASFVLGLGLLVLDAFRRRVLWRPAVKRVVVSVVAASSTAHGFAIWSILGGFVTNREALSFISEWAPPDLLAPATFPYVLLLAAVLFAAASGRVTRRDLWVVVPFLVYGLTSARAVFPAAIVIVPFAALAWNRDRKTLVRNSGSRFAVVNWTLAIALISVPLVILARFPGLDDERFPIEAARYLDTGPVWHDDATGGYLIYSSGPQLQVFVDDRAELYGAEFYEGFVNVRRGTPDWRSSFTGYGIRRALVNRDDGLAKVLTDEHWVRSYEDDHWILFAAP